MPRRETSKFKTKIDVNKVKKRRENLEEYLTRVKVSEDSTPTFMAITELYYGRSKENKLRALRSNHFLLILEKKKMKRKKKHTNYYYYPKEV